MVSGGGTNKVARRGEETRKRVLDAAEVLFSHRGYDGTSMRDLANMAQVRLSLLHYHFGSKENVLAAAMERKLARLEDTIRHSFDTAHASDGIHDIEGCVRAFILPFLRISADKDHDLHDFVTMTSHLMSNYRLPEVKPALARLSAVSDVFLSQLRAIRPEAGEGDLLAGVYLIEAALIFMVQDPGFLDDLSDQHHSASRLDQIGGATMRFFAAGLGELLDRPSSKG